MNPGVTASPSILSTIMNSSSSNNGPASEPADQVNRLGPSPTFFNNTWSELQYFRLPRNHRARPPKSPTRPRSWAQQKRSSSGSTCSPVSTAARRAGAPRCADARSARSPTTVARPASAATGSSTRPRASPRWRPRPRTRGASGWRGPCGRRARTKWRVARTTRCA